MSDEKDRRSPRPHVDLDPKPEPISTDDYYVEIELGDTANVPIHPGTLP